METGFWAKISRDSNNVKRSAEDQAAMQLLQQWLAGLMNKYGIGTSNYGTLLDDGRDALCDPTSTQSELVTLAGQIGAINEQDHSAIVNPLVPIPMGADPKAAKAAAEAWMSNWDEVLPP